MTKNPSRQAAGTGQDPRTISLADEDPSETAALRKQVAELKEAVRARDEFISIAAHELRNPMTPLLMQVHTLLAAARSLEGQGTAAQRVVQGLERLQWVVDQYVKRTTTLLDISRITSGKLQLEPAEVDLSALVHEIVAAQAPLAERAGSPLALNIAAGVIGIWDRLAVEQVIDNLLSNAIKYGGGRPIAVSLERGNSKARLEVADRGIGISPEDRARIFGRFERAVSQHQHGGFGIGLWIVGRLVQAMGGEISVESRLGEGSTFAVDLPITSSS